MANYLLDKIPDWLKSLWHMENELRRPARNGLTSELVDEDIAVKRTVRMTIRDFKLCQRSDDLAASP
jgi:hypothetical protein